MGKYIPRVLLLSLVCLFPVGCAKIGGVSSPAAQTSTYTPIATKPVQPIIEETAMKPSETLPELQAVSISNAKNLQLLKTLPISGFSPSQVSQCSVDFSPDGSLLAGVCYKNTAPLWEARSGKLLFELLKSPEHIVAASFSPDGKTLAIGGFSGKIALYDTGNGQSVGQFSAIPSAVWELSFSPAGDQLASASINSGVQLWERATGAVMWSYGVKERLRVLSVAYAQDGKTIACGMLTGGVVLLDARSGQVVRTLPVKDHVGDVRFSPAGDLLAAGSDDNLIRLWKTADYSLVNTFEGHSDFVNGVAFSPDGKLLVSGSHDKTLGVWDVSNGKLLKTLNGHEGVVLRVAVNAGGTVIASISWDGTVRLWGVTLQDDYE
jgi:WD40 repeat protein